MNKVQQQVAEQEQVRLKILGRIQEYDDTIAQAFSEQQSFHQGALNPDQLQNFPNYIWRLKQNRFQEFQALQSQDRVLTQLRQALHKALIQKKSLDTLKDKDYQAYRRMVEKAEEEFLAEIALTRAVRQTSPL